MSLDDGMKKIGHLPPFWNLKVSVLFKKLDYKYMNTMLNVFFFDQAKSKQ